ncbi:Methyltransferase, UbiE/COQ5 family [Sulfitobacter noctilucae]|uniref:class I SAM-dependent methyltransferase n=1 Tax=Sulfitobacter noctilucae TaxID=1342302 RepID=UPI000469639A|nr:class I SAM-dependent methyltransferase [Sulfitobacter noctilucae]KIN65390.1 Methyltransferase, UbiE/COQ5 family [Sulfitobacter noctilucae]
MIDAAGFWDKHAAKYAQAKIRNTEAYEYTLGRTRSFLNASDRVLEIGCGTGSTALALAANVQSITGTDVSPAMIEIAKDKAADQRSENATFQVMSAEEAVALDAPFDVVMGFNIFHLTDDPKTLFAAIHKQLAPGGYFISKTPCLAEPSIGLKRFAIRAIIPVMQLIGKAPLVHCLTNADVDRMITEAGFEIVEAGNYPAMSRYVVARRV